MLFRLWNFTWVVWYRCSEFREAAMMALEWSCLLGGSAKDPWDSQFMAIFLQRRWGGGEGRKTVLLFLLLCSMGVEASEVGAALQWAEIPSVDMDRPPGTSMVARSHYLPVFLYFDQWLDLAENGVLLWMWWRWAQLAGPRGAMRGWAGCQGLLLQPVNFETGADARMRCVMYSLWGEIVHLWLFSSFLCVAHVSA